jgi:hypothetical protein
MCRCTVVQKIPGPTFLKLRPNAMNSSDQSPNHLFKKFAVYSLFFRHKFMMNETFSIKKCSQTFLSPAIFTFSISELLSNLADIYCAFAYTLTLCTIMHFTIRYLDYFPTIYVGESIQLSLMAARLRLTRSKSKSHCD